MGDDVSRHDKGCIRYSSSIEKVMEHLNNLSDPEEILRQVDEIVAEETAKYLKSIPNIDDVRGSDDCPFSREEIKDALKNNEVGDAALFVRMFRNKLLYDHAAGDWYVWNGQYWELDKCDKALADVYEMANMYKIEIDRQLWSDIDAGNTKR